MKINCSLLFFFFAAVSLSLSAQAAAKKMLPGNVKPEHEIKDWDFPTYPAPNYGTGLKARLIKRGEYLVRMSDCISCHTKPGGRPFAGGLGLKTPFGVFYTPNITSDKETGLGKWSDDDFIRAARHGVRPDGKHYFPVFPYTSFTKIHKQDLLAIKAYLDAIPAVNSPQRENRVPFPFSWRFLQMGWKWLYFDEGVYQYDREQSKEWNRGAYLVQGLGHCGECHTPRNIFGAVDKDKQLNGAFIDGFFAPNITGDGLQGASTQEIVNVFKKGRLINEAGEVRGPMAEVQHNSLRFIKAEDLKAIAVYLKSLETVNKSRDTIGKEVYLRKCSTCHDTGAAGAPKLGDGPNWKKRLEQGKAKLYEHALHGFRSMPARGTCVSCTDDEIKAAVDYILAHSKSKGTGRAPTAVAAPVDGKAVYEKQCQSCHVNGTDGAPSLTDKEAWKSITTQNFDVILRNVISGYRKMPARGGCENCSNAQLKAALKYMLETTDPQTDYSLW